MADPTKSKRPFGSILLIVGAVALAVLLFWGWYTGEDLPVWPALLVAAVNLVGAYRLLQAMRVQRAAQQATATAAEPVQLRKRQ